MGKRGLEFERRVTADQAATFLEEMAKGEAPSGLD
jgi:hypothetical protein